MSTILRVNNLSKSFGRKTVLKDFSMTLEKGKVYGLLGINGAGKTTLIRMITGTIPKDSGEIIYKEAKLRYNDIAYKKDIGFIAEESVFFSWMTVEELLDFNAAFYPSWNSTKVNEYLERFSLPGKIKIRNMSRGMKLKLGLIAALGSEPELLILDDPTSGMDVPTRQDFLRGIIREILDSGTTILFASHMVHELEGIIDQLGIIHGGSLILEDKYSNVKNATRRIHLLFRSSVPEKIELGGILTQSVQDNRMEIVVYPWDQGKQKIIDAHDATIQEEESLSLEEIFVSFISKESERVFWRR